MSDLMSLLSIGAASLAAQNSGVAVASNNVANANTVGYSRERVDLEAMIGAPNLGGVRSNDPQRYADELLGNRIRLAAGSLAMAKSSASALADLQDAVSSNGATVDEQLATLFSDLGQVSASPTDSSLRDQAVTAQRELVAGIRRRAAAIDDQRQQANERIIDNSNGASQLAKQLASFNLQIQKNGADPMLKDQRDQIATQLSQLVGGSAHTDANGQMRFILDGGAVVVDGVAASKIETATDPTTGNAIVQVVDGATRRDVTQQIAGGAIGADVSARDKSIAGAAAGLDQLAYDISTKLNAVHAGNAGLDGVNGRNMFVQPTQVAGAAASMAVDPALDADPSKLAAAAPGAGPGDNTGALALYNLASQGVAAGGKTLGNAAIDLATSVGTQASNANSDAKGDQIISDHLAGLRDSLSGVDVQEELTNLSKFQNASSAMTKLISTIDAMLGDFISKV